MTRQFEKPDEAALLSKTIPIGEVLREEHWARFLVSVLSGLDLDCT